MQSLRSLLWSLGILACLPVAGVAQEKLPVILDTDIGTDVDDAFALGLVLASPELDLRGVTTVGEDTENRAWMACRMLSQSGHRPVPVAWGREPQPKEEINWQIQYRRHPAVIFNRTAKPLKISAVDFLYQQLKEQPGTLTLIPVGPLTNIARLIAEHPDCKPWIKRIVLMGGSIRVGYNGKAPPSAEFNIHADIKAAQAVFSSGIPLTVAPLDATTMIKMGPQHRNKLFAHCSPLTYQVQALYQMWEQETPVLYDPVAVTLCITEKFCTMEDLRLEVDDKGFTRVADGKPNARVATSIKIDDFLDWYVTRSWGEALLPKPPQNLSKLIPLDAFPNRVHCFEDYETDIEKRWWMAGKAETKNLPPGSKRACRGVLTQDFDDRMGDTKTAYNAVVFNPVPGPPMGKNPRLRFRYWLQGTESMRVQIYSLSNGYHRYLSLKGLPQESWQWGTVDMTDVRRPDGSGGPLAENERIDDVQFYVDPRAELLIDDMVLYDAPVPGEKRLFPKNLAYTGLFDSGKQGKEWPGSFDILPKKGYFWHAAKSVPQPDGEGRQWIRFHLRGQRPLGDKTELFFRYYLNGASSLELVVRNAKTGLEYGAIAKGVTNDPYAEMTVAFPKAKGNVDEILFRVPAGGELLVDDVLLYEPGKE